MLYVTTDLAVESTGALIHLIDIVFTKTYSRKKYKDSPIKEFSVSIGENSKNLIKYLRNSNKTWNARQIDISVLIIRSKIFRVQSIKHIRRLMRLFLFFFIKKHINLY